MSQLRISILDPSGGKKTLVEVPDNVEVTRLVRALASRMGMPDLDASGSRIVYRLGASRNGEDVELDGDFSLKEQSVCNDEILRLYAVMKAGCFPPTMRVTLADGTKTPIELLFPGAKILSYDTLNHKLCTGTVKERTTTSAVQYCIVNGTLHVTPSHPVYADDKWILAGDLREGQSLLSDQGRPWPIVSIERCSRLTFVHNLHLSNPEHTFFVEGALVHNESAKAVDTEITSDAQELILEGASPRFLLHDDERRLLVSEIIDAFEARTLVKIIGHFEVAKREQETFDGTIVATPIFGPPKNDSQYKCEVFMIMPFSAEFQSIYEDYIVPVVESFHLKISRADDFFTRQSIF